MKKALVISTLLFACCAGGNNRNGNNQQAQTSAQEETSQPVAETTSKREPMVLTAGSEITLSHNGGGEAKFLFKEVKPIRLSNGTYNLVLKVQIKNTSNEQLFISDISWKLTDTDMIEIEESGVYDPTFGEVMPGGFFFTIVEPGFGAVEEVGYEVRKGTYYLCIAGQVRGVVTV